MAYETGMVYENGVRVVSQYETYWLFPCSVCKRARWVLLKYWRVTTLGEPWASLFSPEVFVFVTTACVFCRRLCFFMPLVFLTRPLVCAFDLAAYAFVPAVPVFQPAVCAFRVCF